MKHLPPPIKLLILLAIVATVVVALWPRSRTGASEPLICFVGGTMTPVFEALAQAYAQNGGDTVTMTSAGSGELLATIEMHRQGDLYVSHDPFMDVAMKRGLGVNAWRIAHLVPVLVVQKGNPKRIHSLKDLLRPELRVFLTDYQHSTLGHLLPTMFRRAGIDFGDVVGRKNIDTHRAGSQVANMIIMDAADAGVVWQAVAHLRAKDLDVVRIDENLPIPGVDAITSATGKTYPLMPVKVTITSLSCSQRQADASAFVAFIASPRGQALLRNFGYDVPPECGRLEYANGLKLHPDFPQLTNQQSNTSQEIMP